MQELKSAQIGNRRVRLTEDGERFTVRIEVYADGAWHDISFRSDRDFGNFARASRRFRERVAEQDERLSVA